MYSDNCKNTSRLLGLMPCWLRPQVDAPRLKIDSSPDTFKPAISSPSVLKTTSVMQLCSNWHKSASHLFITCSSKTKVMIIYEKKIYMPIHKALSYYPVCQNWTTGQRLEDEQTPLNLVHAEMSLILSFIGEEKNLISGNDSVYFF